MKKIVLLIICLCFSKIYCNFDNSNFNIKEVDKKLSKLYSKIESLKTSILVDSQNINAQILATSQLLKSLNKIVNLLEQKTCFIIDEEKRKETQTELRNVILDLKNQTQLLKELTKPTGK